MEAQMKRLLTLSVICILLLSLGVSCKLIMKLFFKTGVTFDSESFEKEYQLWKKRNCNDYSFVFYDSTSYDCGEKFKVAVYNDLDEYDSLDENKKQRYAEKIKSMEDVFEYVKELETYLEKSSAKTNDVHFTFTMDFDEIYHFPKKIHVSTQHKDWDLGTKGGYWETIEVEDFALSKHKI